MKKLVRFGVSLDHHLLDDFDKVVRRRKYATRSEALRDLIRDQLVSQEMSAYEATASTGKASTANSLPIQIEIRNAADVHEALLAGADSILLTDVTQQEAGQIVECARGVRPDSVIEISGDISVSDARGYAETGADYLSPRGLTMAAPWARLAMLVDGAQEK